MKKRSARIIMSNEARVLKDLRIQHGLSMRNAGSSIGRSDSYIAHIETGRMDTPKGLRLDRLLAIYGGIKQKTFYERVRQYQLLLSPKEELLEAIERLPNEKIATLLAIAKSIL
jgi:transcriptional regulator with XRE-family HTH domain